MAIVEGIQVKTSEPNFKRVLAAMERLGANNTHLFPYWESDFPYLILWADKGITHGILYAPDRFPVLPSSIFCELAKAESLETLLAKVSE